MSSKRKSAGSGGNAASPDPKRRKLPSPEETPESTTETGLAVLEHLKSSRDKKGQQIAEPFLTLPRKKDVPDYYDVILLPIAFDTIEAKLKRHEYPNMTAVESDFKRMIANAKYYNEKGSDIHDLSEKLRKLVSNHMTKKNPAYKDPDYTPFATPLPGEDESDAQSADEEEKKKPGLVLHGPKDPEKSGNKDAEEKEEDDEEESFQGKTFQQAQEQLILELLDLETDDGESISGPFANLPPRDLKDYYQLIKNPVSLKSIQKRIKGIRGRDKPTGVSAFKSWQSVEEEISLIWKNAREYNEDDSDISRLATELEAYFNTRIAKAREAVAEPPQPKINLRVGGGASEKAEPSPKLKLTMSSRSANEPNGVIVDSAALKRQQDMVSSRTNGTPAKSVSVEPAGERSRSASIANGIKSETRSTHSPAAESHAASEKAAENGMLPPSAAGTRVASGSPHPQSVPPPPPPQPTNPLDNRFRTGGKTAGDALIANVNVSTHPGLHLPNTFNLSIPPSDTLSQQSITISLPATHFCLRVSPTFSSIMFQRQYKYFVTCNGQRLQPVALRPDQADLRRPLFDTRMIPGLNIIEIECITGPPRGAPKIGNAPDIEFEKTTIYANIFGN